MSEYLNDAPREAPSTSRPLLAEAKAPAMPRWVKALLVALAVVVVAVLVKVLVGGEHGPAMHGAAPTSELASRTASVAAV